jgi:hypothetical protein
MPFRPEKIRSASYHAHLAECKADRIYGPEVVKMGLEEYREGIDFVVTKQFLDADNEWRTLTVFTSAYDDMNDDCRRLLAIPIAPVVEEDDDELWKQVVSGFNVNDFFAKGKIDELKQRFTIKRKA